MQTTDPQLRGKVAIVTGAGRGIGKAIASAYAREGAAVCCTARTVAEIDETVQDIVASGGQGLAVPTDVTQLAAVQEMVRVTVETFGGLDILVINAGVSGEGRPVEDGDPEAGAPRSTSICSAPITVRRPRSPPSNSGGQERSSPSVRVSGIAAWPGGRTMRVQRLVCGCSPACWHRSCGRIISA